MQRQSADGRSITELPCQNGAASRNQTQHTINPCVSQCRISGGKFHQTLLGHSRSAGIKLGFRGQMIHRPKMIRSRSPVNANPDAKPLLRG
jgi:hypothetical protein